MEEINCRDHKLCESICYAYRTVNNKYRHIKLVTLSNVRLMTSFYNYNETQPAYTLKLEHEN